MSVLRQASVVGMLAFLLTELAVVSPLYATDNAMGDAKGDAKDNATDDSTGNTYSISVKQGIEAYKNNAFLKSKRFFIRSVLNAKDSEDRAIALHNLGNTLFQMGDYVVAAELFADALRYNPKQDKSQKNLALSVVLFLEQEKRLKRKMDQGNFAVPDDVNPLFDLPEQLPFMLSTKAVNLLKASLPKLPAEELNRLLGKGLQKFKLLQGNEKQNSKQQKKKLEMQQARLYLMEQEEQASNQLSNGLWKRLFEIEEGFSGQLKEPEIVQGVRSW